MILCILSKPGKTSVWECIPLWKIYKVKQGMNNTKSEENLPLKRKKKEGVIRKGHRDDSQSSDNA